MLSRTTPRRQTFTCVPSHDDLWTDLLESAATSSWMSCRGRNLVNVVSVPCLRTVQVRIVKEDGAVGLFRGAGPTVVRAMALNMGMLASNDQVRTHMSSLPLLPFPMPSGVEGSSMQNGLLQGAASDWAKPND